MHESGHGPVLVNTREVSHQIGKVTSQSRPALIQPCGKSLLEPRRAAPVARLWAGVYSRRVLDRATSGSLFYCAEKASVSFGSARIRLNESIHSGLTVQQSTKRTGRWCNNIQL